MACQTTASPCNPLKKISFIFMIAGFLRQPFGDDDQIQGRLKRRTVRSENFSNHALEPVATNCVAILS